MIKMKDCDECVWGLPMPCLRETPDGIDDMVKTAKVVQRGDQEKPGKPFAVRLKKVSFFPKAVLAPMLTAESSFWSDPEGMQRGEYDTLLVYPLLGFPEVRSLPGGVDGEQITPYLWSVLVSESAFIVACFAVNTDDILWLEVMCHTVVYDLECPIVKYAQSYTLGDWSINQRLRLHR
jgi:hypothetical protein